MTEAEWLTCQEPAQMLYFLGREPGECKRKFRLFAVACCRRLWHLLIDARSEHLLEVAELYAEGQSSSVELKRARRMAERSVYEAATQARRQAARAAVASCLVSPREAAQRASSAILAVENEDAAAQAHSVSFWRTAGGTYGSTEKDPFEIGALGETAERFWQIGALHEIFGNPFRPVSVNPSWLAWNGGTLVCLAQAIYADRSFDRLPILADALEDAGCSAADILAHCRGGGEHVRGCWVVDLLLGK
jgi:hypothetical protein